MPPMARWPRDPLMVLYMAFLVSLPLVRPPALSVGGAPVQVADLLIVAVYALWAYRLVKGRARIRGGGLILAAGLYIVVLAVSCLFGADPLKKSLLKLAAYSAYLLFPALSVSVLDSEERLAQAVRGWLIGGLVAVGIGLFGLGAWYADRHGFGKPFACATYGLLPSGNYPRLCASFQSPNLFANYLIVILALALACGTLLARSAYVAVAVAAGTVVMMFTLSAGFGGYVIAGAMVLIASFRMRGAPAPLARVPARLRDGVIAAGAGLLAVFFAVTMISMFVPRGEGHLTVGSQDVRFMAGSRPSIWKSAVETIKQRPVLGKGYGTMVAFSNDPKVFLSPDQLSKLKGPVAGAPLEGHNVWLSVTGQAGILGLAAFGFLLYRLMQGLPALRTRSINSPSPSPDLALLPVALIAALAGAFFYHGLFGALEEARHLWPFLGLAAAAVSLRSSASAPSATR